MFFFFFNDTATTEIYTLSLHDALPISVVGKPCMEHILELLREHGLSEVIVTVAFLPQAIRSYFGEGETDRKSTRLNSSHSQISYAVFCLKKKNKHWRRATRQVWAQSLV